MRETFNQNLWQLVNFTQRKSETENRYKNQQNVLLVRSNIWFNVCWLFNRTWICWLKLNIDTKGNVLKKEEILLPHLITMYLIWNWNVQTIPIWLSWKGFLLFTRNRGSKNWASWCMLIPKLKRCLDSK